MNNREELEQKLNDLEAQKVALFDSGSADQAAVIRINEDIKAVRQQLNAFDTQEAIIAEVNDPGSSFSLSARGFTADFRALTKGEDEYQMASVTTQLYLAEIDIAHESEIKAIRDSFESELESAENSKKLLEEELEQTRNDLSDVRGKLEIATNQMTDLEIERDSAVKEAESLRKQVEELRQQITEKPKATTNLDVGNSLAEINARLEAKKIPVYNVRPGDHKTSFYFAQLAETGEEIEIRPYYELKSKYRELSEEEAGRFREEAQQAQQAELESIPETAATAEPVSDFPLPAPELSSATIPEHTIDREVATTATEDAVTIEERLAALEMAVFGQAKAAA